MDQSFIIANPNHDQQLNISEQCPASMRECIPCMDNVEAIKELKSTKKGEKFDRHFPEKGKGLNCLVPTPKGNKAPIPWPRSRDEVWHSNLPHAQLAEYKVIDHILKMIPEIAFGHHTRVVLDVGCGVASFGAYLTSRDVLTLSVAPKDVHENQIQLALELACLQWWLLLLHGGCFIRAWRSV
ncbi:hypothetical protein L1987_57711 [Smallanthus sonchifolius]|uniref:Uncharacterized protein n=1 Tax=Smallanthus sonchifolius TaxID=185202 RepID=A0ACB9DD91_9ASTR|nr:hypothetical protein L1987_57711 [Smallanthus sonchifolius]